MCSDFKRKIVEQSKAPCNSNGKRLTDKEKKVKVDEFKNKLREAKILTIDSDWNARIFYSKLFINSESFKEFQSVVSEIETQKYDLFILGLHLDDMDGIEAMKKIRKSNMNSDTPILLITGDVIRENEIYS